MLKEEIDGQFSGLISWYIQKAENSIVHLVDDTNLAILQCFTHGSYLCYIGNLFSTALLKFFAHRK